MNPRPTTGSKFVSADYEHITGKFHPSSSRGDDRHSLTCACPDPKHHLSGSAESPLDDHFVEQRMGNSAVVDADDIVTLGHAQTRSAIDHSHAKCGAERPRFEGRTEIDHGIVHPAEPA